MVAGRSWLRRGTITAVEIGKRRIPQVTPACQLPAEEHIWE